MWFKLATAKFTNHLGSMESLSKSYRITYETTGLSGSPALVPYTTLGESISVTFTFTVKTGYEFKSGSTITCGGSTIFTAGQDYAAGSTFTATANINASVSVSGTASAVTPDPDVPTLDPEDPVNPPSGDGTTTVDYGTLISNPTNLRGGVVDYIIVKPEFYASILNKKITKIRVYKVTDSSSASKTTIGIGKVALSGAFKTSSQTASGLATAYSNISSYKTYDVASYANKTMMELDCDITLSEGEYLCFDVKNGHCVGYCNDIASSQQMMYVYQSQAEPRDETSQQVPISVTVEE